MRGFGAARASSTRRGSVLCFLALVILQGGGGWERNGRKQISQSHSVSAIVQSCLICVLA